MYIVDKIRVLIGWPARLDQWIYTYTYFSLSTLKYYLECYWPDKLKRDFETKNYFIGTIMFHLSYSILLRRSTNKYWFYFELCEKSRKYPRIFLTFRESMILWRNRRYCRCLRKFLRSLRKYTWLGMRC